MMVFDEYPHSRQETQLSNLLFFKRLHLLQQSHSVKTFFLARNCSDQIIAEFHAHVDADNHWVSLLKAPFGGIVFQDECTESELTFFLKSIQEWLALSSCKSLTIKAPPSCYNNDRHEKTHLSYINTGLYPYCTLQNQYILVTETNFFTIVSKPAARRLRKSSNADFKSGLDRKINFDKTYAFIQLCRKQKGHTIPLSKQELKTLTENFPDHFLTFTVTHQSEIAALIMAVRVAPDVLYVFLSDFDIAYANYSPIVLLTQTLYQFCQQQGCKILDLGTSMDHTGQHKASLSRFKRSLGARECVKVTYHYDF